MTREITFPVECTVKISHLSFTRYFIRDIRYKSNHYNISSGVWQPSSEHRSWTRRSPEQL